MVRRREIGMLTQVIKDVLNVKVLVGAFNKKKALVGALSVITNLRMDLFQALFCCCCCGTIICTKL